jgi:hypothetical protein
MYFQVKNTLESNRYYTPKHPLTSFISFSYSTSDLRI